MKPYFIIIALICGTGIALSQANTNTRMQGESSNRGLIDISNILDKSVKGLNGDNLGDIDQLLVDPNTGRIRYAVIEVDKAWNWNEPKVAVPFQALQVTHKGNNNVQFTLDATKEKLEKAPKFRVGDAERLYSREASQPIYSYWAILWYDDSQENQQDRNTGATQNRQNERNRTMGKTDRMGTRGSGRTNTTNENFGGSSDSSKTPGSSRGTSGQ